MFQLNLQFYVSKTPTTIRTKTRRRKDKITKKELIASDNFDMSFQEESCERSLGLLKPKVLPPCSCGKGGRVVDGLGALSDDERRRVEVKARGQTNCYSIFSLPTVSETKRQPLVTPQSQLSTRGFCGIHLLQSFSTRPFIFVFG